MDFSEGPLILKDWVTIMRKADSALIHTETEIKQQL